MSRKAEGETRPLRASRKAAHRNEDRQVGCIVSNRTQWTTVLAIIVLLIHVPHKLKFLFFLDETLVPVFPYNIINQKQQAYTNIVINGIKNSKITFAKK